MQLSGLQVGHYEIQEHIGQGGAGDVYLAQDQNLRRQVALKVVRADTPLAAESESVQRALRLFKREAEIVAKFNHRHILPLHDYGETILQGTRITYMIMPYCKAGSLR